MTFTLAHGLVVSLALHGALILPFVVELEQLRSEEAPVLVVELQGFMADTQTVQQAQQETRGAPEQDAQDEAKEEQKTEADQAPSPQEPPQEVDEAGALAAPPPPTPEQKAQEAPPQDSATPAPAQSGNPGAANIAGAQVRKEAQTISREADEAELLRAYARVLAKKVQENLVYPHAGRKAGLVGTAQVAFALEADGSIRPGSLKIARSSGQSVLDASALKTVEASAPFGIPPRPVSLAIAVIYGPKR